MPTQDSVERNCGRSAGMHALSIYQSTHRRTDSPRRFPQPAPFPCHTRHPRARRAAHGRAAGTTWDCGGRCLTRRGGFVPANRATTAVIGRRGLFFVKEKTFLTWTSTPGLALQSRRGACFLSGGACTPDFQAFWLSRGDPHLWGSAEARMPGPGRIQSHSWV